QSARRQGTSFYQEQRGFLHIRCSPCSCLTDFPNRASPVSKRCPARSQGCRRLPMDGRPRRARIGSCLLRASQRKPSPLLRVAWANQSSPAPSSVLSSTASASSATICSASLLIGLMPSSAPSVTKAELPQLLKAFRGPGFAEDPCFSSFPYSLLSIPLSPFSVP